MLRCMTNNYSGLSFWRSWHRSFNLWIVRYIYVPLGGRSGSIINIWIIFTFVAIWHDRDMKLLAWGWLIVLFVLPEILLTNIGRSINVSEYALVFCQRYCGCFCVDFFVETL